MLLVSPSDAAVGIGAKCGGATPSPADADLTAILNYLTPKVEDALNVKSLVRGVYTDRFRVPGTGTTDNGERVLALTNAFLVKNTLVITDPNEVGVLETDTENLDIDYEMGTITLVSPIRGSYTIQYESGFAPKTVATPPTPPETLPLPDADTRVLAGIPMWMQGIVLDYLVEWYRTTRISPLANPKLSYGQLTRALDKDLYARIYMRYMRPRVGVIFGDRRG